MNNDTNSIVRISLICSAISIIIIILAFFLNDILWNLKKEILDADSLTIFVLSSLIPFIIGIIFYQKYKKYIQNENITKWLKWLLIVNFILFVIAFVYTILSAIAQI